MRHSYLVAYDVSDDKRLRALFIKLHGFGRHVQYSVFCCDLSPRERALMVEAILGIIHEREDRVIIVDVGPSDGRARVAFRYLGRQDPVVVPRGPLIV